MRIPTIVVALPLLAACASAGSQTTGRDVVPTIATSGEGRRDVMPDKATIVLGVETRARTPAAAGSANADRMTAIRAALVRAGVADSNITTARYNLYLQQGRTMADTQYVASNMVTVETRQLDQVGRIIDVGLGAGANNIGSLQYDVVDRSAATAAALGDAVSSARRQAEVMAQAAGGSLGDLIELTTQPGEYRPFFAQDAAMRMSAAAAPTPISPGAVTVTAGVTGRWRFVPGR